MTCPVLIAHAEGEEDLAEQLAEPIRAAGYEVAHRGTVMIGESVIAEAAKILGMNGPVVLCGTVRAMGTRWARRVVNAARQYSGVRVFVVQMEQDADVESIALGDSIARYWENPVKAIESLLASLQKYYPLASTQNEIASAVVSAFRSLHQLPQPPADFTGREELIAQLLADFESGKGATITGQAIHGLVGMGGIGKTALGLVVAHQLKKDYPDAQIFLDLKGTTTPLSAMDVMRHVILSFEPTADVRSLDEAGMTGAYQSVLTGKQVLLFLDNARSAAQLAPLRPPETCTLLVTSRWNFSLPGLRTHHLHVMSPENAKAFLLELSPRIGEHAAALATACACLPLALRIAGSFLQVNSNWQVERYITQLNDRKHRLATLEQSRAEAELKTEPDLLATFELSYHSLSEENQKHWRMLGVFPTSFDADAAEAMWKLDPQGDETARVLGLLHRYSLLDYDETFSRCSLHDLLADYALSQMDSEEERETRLKHASHYNNVLKAANTLYYKGGENVLTGLRLFDLEWENIRTGQAWVSQNADDKHYLELCDEYPNAGYMILILRLHPRAYIVWLEQGLAAARKLGNEQYEGFHLGNLGVAYKNLGEVRKAIKFSEEHLAIAREIGDRRGEGAALNNLGNAYSVLGEVRKAIEFYEQRLAIARETGDRRGEGAALGNLGVAHRDLGELRKAIEFDEQGLVILRELGDRHGEGAVLSNLGIAYKDLGEVRKAIEFYEQSLVIKREIGDRQGEENALINLGTAYFTLKEYAKAENYYRQCMSITQEIGDKRGEASAFWGLAICKKQAGDRNGAREMFQKALEIFQEIESPSAKTMQEMLDDLEKEA